MSDWVAILISFIYVFAALGIAEGLRKTRNYSPDFTRKFVHIAVGMWAIGTVFLFQSRWMAVIPPATFILLNTLSYRQAMFKAIEHDDKANLGTIYFPAAFCLILLLLWDYPNLVVAALMPLTWGDALAAIIGKTAGQRPYQIWGQRRTLEGSAAMLLFSIVSTWLALLLIPPTIHVGGALAAATITGLAATFIEAISPWGIDNLTIPAVSGLILVAYFG